MKIRKNSNERQSFKDAPAELRNDIAKQYEPLVNKIVKQFYNKLHYDWDSLKSLAYEGLVLSLNGYDPEKSKMTFTQYTAFAIRNNILNGLTEELHTIKITSYGVQQAKQDGQTTFTSLSMSAISGETSNEDKCSKEAKYGLFTESKVYGDPISILMQEIRNKFKERDQHMFFSYYGLGDYEELKVTDLAKLYNVTNGFVSQRIKNVIKFIKTREDLMELLASLMDK